jgi:rhodanese-related sulfurtransferase
MAHTTGTQLTPKRAMEMVAEARERIDTIGPEELAPELEQGDVVVVDLRESEERVEHGAIPAAVHVPRGRLEFDADPTSPFHHEDLDPARRTVVHCAIGGRGALATDTLRQMGYGNVANLGGGFDAWKEAGGRIEHPEDG